MGQLSFRNPYVVSACMLVTVVPLLFLQVVAVSSGLKPAVTGHQQAAGDPGESGVQQQQQQEEAAHMVSLQQPAAVSSSSLEGARMTLHASNRHQRCVQSPCTCDHGVNICVFVLIRMPRYCSC